MRKKLTGWKVTSKEAVIHWEIELEGRPPKMVDFAISMTATELERQPCVWRADTAHGYAHEHQEWNKRLIPLTEKKSNYQNVFEKCLKRISKNHEKFIQLFKNSLAGE